MIMLGIRVATEGERPIPSVPRVRQRILARASQRSFSVEVRRGFRTYFLRYGRPQRKTGIETVGRDATSILAWASVQWYLVEMYWVKNQDEPRLRRYTKKAVKRRSTGFRFRMKR
jgi:hypothetical protein